MILRAHVTVADEKLGVRVLNDWTVRGDDELITTEVQLLVDEGFPPSDGFPVDALIARMERLFGPELLTIDERTEAPVPEEEEEGLVY